MIEEETSPLNEDKPAPVEKRPQARGVLKRPSTSENLGSGPSPSSPEALATSPSASPRRSVAFQEPLDGFETDTTAGGDPSAVDDACDGTYLDYFRNIFEKQSCCRDTSGEDDENPV